VLKLARVALHPSYDQTMSTETFGWRVERFAYYNGYLCAEGWAFHTEDRLTSLFVELPDGRSMEAPDYGLPSPDVSAVHGDRAASCRFSIRVAISNADEARQAKLVLRSRRRAHVIDTPTEELNEDSFRQLFPRFHQMVRSTTVRPTIIEIGSRARSGNVNVDWLPDGSNYIGFDILNGPNVDVVGDAHEIAKHFESSSTDAIFSVSTIEHLAMPWKATAQINNVLRLGGLLFFASHQTWPVHDSPWDFWRFTSDTWRALLNRDTGFEIVEVAMGERASIVANYLSPSTVGLDLQPAFLGTSVIARKTASTELSWNVDPRLAADHPYPK